MLARLGSSVAEQTAHLYRTGLSGIATYVSNSISLAKPGSDLLVFNHFGLILNSAHFRFRELDHHHHPPQQASFGIEDVPKKPREAAADVTDWASELRPSMRKLRQGMDSLCKTARLACSVLRLHQTMDAVDLSHAIKYRRDVCFSQALTSLISALMAR